MKYVLLLMGDYDADRCGATEDAPSAEDFIAFDAELEKAGVLAGGFGLQDPELGVHVRRPPGRTEAVVTTGPYAEAREFVGGTIVIDVPDMDAALAWAEKCPGTRGGRVEVRPMLEL